jgi:hypothetical protein
MKMAKASPVEIKAALELSQLTESVCHPRAFCQPQFPDTDDKEGEWFDEHNPKDLREFLWRVRSLSAGLVRVVFGFQVLVDNCCDPEKDVLDWKPELMQYAWQKELPSESGLWWWWNGDEDAAPIPVTIMYSGCGDNYFAPEGQYGWTRFQAVEEMGGWWKRLPEPLLPKEDVSQ